MNVLHWLNYESDAPMMAVNAEIERLEAQHSLPRVMQVEGKIADSYWVSSKRSPG
jgi:CRISPR/Cas system-associated endonuclease Cas1